MRQKWIMVVLLISNFLLITHVLQSQSCTNKKSNKHNDRKKIHLKEPEGTDKLLTKTDDLDWLTFKSEINDKMKRLCTRKLKLFNMLKSQEKKMKEEPNHMIICKHILANAANVPDRRIK